MEESEHRVQIGVIDLQRSSLIYKTESGLGRLIPQHNLLHLLPRRLGLHLYLDERECLITCVTVEKLLVAEDHLHLVGRNLTAAECLCKLPLEIALCGLVRKTEIEVRLESIHVGTNRLSLRRHTKEVDDEALLVKVC